MVVDEARDDEAGVFVHVWRDQLDGPFKRRLNDIVLDIVHLLHNLVPRLPRQRRRCPAEASDHGAC